MENRRMEYKKFERKKSAEDVIFGVRAVIEAIKADREINKILIQKVNSTLMKIFFKVFYLVRLKEVLSGKLRNRLVSNYFKKIRYEFKSFSVLESSIFFLDSTYSSTIAINSIYNSFLKD